MIQRPLKSLLLGVGCSVLALGGGCAPISSGDASKEVGTTDGDGAAGEDSTLGDLYQRMVDAPFRVAYRGRRLAEFHYEVGDRTATTSFHEDVVSDGAGKFRVALAPDEEVDSDEAWLTRQTHARRSGFILRVRDFRIRDLQRFHENYHVVDLVPGVYVAGHACTELRIERKGRPHVFYLVRVEPESGLTLSWEERSYQTGSLHSRVVFETIELEPTLSGAEIAALDDHLLEREAPSSELDIALFRPRWLPGGFEVVSSEVVTSPVDVVGEPDSWSKTVYGDGVEELIFLQGTTLAPSQPGGGGGDVIDQTHIGPWSVSDGKLHGRRVVLLGKLPEEDLLLVLQSLTY